MVKKLYTADDPDDKGDGDHKKEKKIEGVKEIGDEEDETPTLESFITNEERKTDVRNTSQLNE